MKVNFLRAASGIPLAKTLDPTGKTTASYPMVLEFDSLEFNIDTIEDFYEALKLNAELGHCLLKGELLRPLKNEPRAGSTDPMAPTNWICLDYDGKDAYDSIDDYLNDIGVGGVDYILQYSASAGFTSETKHKSHVFMLLENPTDPTIIKRWVTGLNLENPRIKSRITLDRTENSPLWALDVSTGQNDKLLYIAPPICPVVKITDRIQLHKRTRRSVQMIPSVSNELITNKKEALINALRAIKGLPPKKKQTYSSVNGVSVLKGCPPCDITGHKIERGFHRININGGSSWGYYFPESNIEIVYNFRGETPVLLKELAPAFYAALKKEATKGLSTGKPLAIHDPETDAYWCILHDADNRLISANTIASKDRITDFLAQYGQPKPPFIPDWTVSLNPENIEPQVNYEDQTINMFRPTEYLLAEPGTTTIPPTISELLHHICVDEPTFSHLINWMAVVFQTRTRAGTAWVFQGTYGTGKGVLFHRILAPIFGHRHAALITISNLEDQFNSFLENAIILYVDEANMANLREENKVWNKLKSYITDERMAIRGMKRNVVIRQNNVNVILPTNEYIPLKIENTDRRMNITPRQEIPLPLTKEQIETGIKSELMDFASYLAGFPADKVLAASPLRNRARDDLVDASKNSVDLFFAAIREGDLSYFQQFEDDSPGALSNLAYGDFKTIIDRWTNERPTEISAAEILRVYKYLHGEKTITPAKFSRMCAHHRCACVSTTGKPMRDIVWQTS
jgi:hypothetical protein